MYVNTIKFNRLYYFDYYWNTSLFFCWFPGVHFTIYSCLSNYFTMV